MKIIATLYRWYGKRTVWVVCGAVLVILLMWIVSGKDDVIIEDSSVVPLVTVATADALSNTQSLELIGTVRSVDEATIDTEVAGRVTAVTVSLGQSITAGQVIAQLENASQYASLLQAEGVYEAAEVAAAASDIGVLEIQKNLERVKQNALSTYKNTYATLNTIHFATLDEIYDDPSHEYRSPSYIPKDFAQKEGQVDALYSDITDRLAAQKNKKVTTATIHPALLVALEDTNTLIDVVSLLQNLLSENKIDETLDSTTQAYLGTLATVSTQLYTLKNALQSAYDSVIASEDAFEKAQLSDTTRTVSSANAQLKQALGALRGAQANYQKTLLRSPIFGVVQSLSVQKGDFVTAYQTIARVAGSGGHEVTTYVGDQDLVRIRIGQTIQLENGASGIITNIAPSVDPVTQKTELRITTQSNTIKNGQTVHISIPQESTSDEVVLPLAALKLTADDAAVFTVIDGVLTAQPVTLGDIRDTTAVITQGLSNTQEVVSDVRGLSPGQTVEIK